MKKKAIKIAASTAVAASAFVAAAPANKADAAVNLDQIVQDAQNAGTVLKWAISVEGSADYVTRPYDTFNAAKKAIAAAEKALKGASTSDKLKYEARLTDPKIQVKRAQAYIDAITSSEKIKELTANLNAAVKSDDIEKVEAAYHKATAEFRKQTVLLDRVYGQSTRDGIRNAVKPALEKLVAELKNDVTVNMLAKAAAADVKADKLEDAAKKLTEAQAILDASVLKWETSLQKSVDDVAAAMPLKVLSVTRVDNNTVTVKFSKQVPDLLAAGQFTFNNDLVVHNAKVADDKKTVTLTTSAQQAAKTYTLSYQGESTGKSFTTPATPADDSIVVEKDTAYLDLGQTRVYTLTVKNTDNRPFNGPATIDLFDIDGTTAATEVEIVTVDGKTVGINTDANQWTGNITDGKVTFVVKADVTQVDADKSTYAQPVITLGTDRGNGVTPDPIKAGKSYFLAAAPNATTTLDFRSASVGGKHVLLSHNKEANYFVAGPELVDHADLADVYKYKYDSNDIFANGSLDTFKNALSSGDIVVVSYNRTAANSSTFNITSDVTQSTLTITNPSRSVSYEGSTYRFEGKGTDGYYVELFKDLNNDGVLDTQELAVGKVGRTATVANGGWSIDAANLTLNAADGNNYIAVQYPSKSSATDEVNRNGNDENNTNVSATFDATASKAQTVYRESFNPLTIKFNDTDGSLGLSSDDTFTFTFDGAYAHEFGTFKTGTITLEQNLKQLVVNVEKVDKNTLRVVSFGTIPADFDAAISGATAVTKVSKVTGLINQDKLNYKPATGAKAAQNTIQ